MFDIDVTIEFDGPPDDDTYDKLQEFLSQLNGQIIEISEPGGGYLYLTNDDKLERRVNG